MAILFLAALEVQTGHALIRAFVLVPDVRIRLDRAGEDAEIGHLADERVSGRLPNIGGQRFRDRTASILLRHPCLGRAFGSLLRRRHQVDDVVQQGDRANFMSACGAEDGMKLPA
jgi:hypothetical protein